MTAYQDADQFVNLDSGNVHIEYLNEWMQTRKKNEVELQYKWFHTWGLKDISSTAYMANRYDNFSRIIPSGAFTIESESRFSLTNEKNTDYYKATKLGETNMTDEITRSISEARSGWDEKQYGLYQDAKIRYGFLSWFEAAFRPALIYRSERYTVFDPNVNERKSKGSYYSQEMSLQFANDHFSESRHKQRFDWNSISDFDQYYGPLSLQGMVSAALVFTTYQKRVTRKSDVGQILKPNGVNLALRCGILDNLEAVINLHNHINLFDILAVYSINVKWQPWKSIRIAGTYAKSPTPSYQMRLMGLF